jgi:hypothetical protein
LSTLITLVAAKKEITETMTVQTVKLGGKSFVIVPEKDFRRLQERAQQASTQDRGDVAESWRRMKEPSGKTLGRIRSELPP